MVHQLRLLFQHLHPPRGSQPIRFTLARETNGGTINSTKPRQYSDAWIGAGLNGVQLASSRSDAGLPAFGAPVNLTIFLAEHSCVVMLPLRLPCDHD
jgi:hypothetical protein